MKPKGKLRKIWVVAATILALGAIALIIPDLRWRSVLIAMKVTGQLELVEWHDVGVLIHPDTAISLRRLVGRRNPYRSVLNPFDSPDDIQEGAKLFARNCAQCHGNNASGASAPALSGRTLNNGDSDWARFKTITEGVPGTAMLPATVVRHDAWRIIAYLTALKSEAITSQQQPTSENTLPEAVTEVSAAMLRNAADEDGWLLPSGSYDGQRYSRAAQITSSNVSKLSVQWIHQFGTADERIETIPIVAGRYMYVTLPGSKVVALDAETGKVIWHYEHPLPDDVRFCCHKSNRGVALSGNRIFMGTLDARLLALDATTGQLIWDQ